MTRRLLELASALACLALAGAALWIARSFQIASAALTAEVSALHRTAAAESAAWRRTTDRQATAYRASLERQIVGLRADLAVQGNELRAVLDRQATELRADLRPAITNAVTLEAEAARSLRLWTPQVLGLLAASKVTAGETATTMREFRRASPALLAGIDRVVANSDRTTAASAQVMNNLARASRPLPLWLRIGLGVAPPMAQTAAAAATTLAITGVLK